MNKKSDTACGTIAIIGRPNAGKSTLLNTLLGQKIAAVSAKAQTTRQRLVGIMLQDQAQLIFNDTPGLFTTKARNKMEQHMLHTAWESVAESDAIMLVLDASLKKPLEQNDDIITRLTDLKRPVFIVLNKIDLVARDSLLPLTAAIHASLPAAQIFMITALTGDGTTALCKALATAMPRGPWLYPTDDLTTAPLRALAAELTREQLYRQLGSELPYDTTVVPETWEDFKNGSVRIGQAIIVARDSQKSIVIGAKGQKLKEIGSAARAEISTLLGCPVHLHLYVKVVTDWQDKRDYV